MIREITDRADFNTVVKSGLTFVDFWAPWCGPCKAARPHLEKLAVEFHGITFVAVDIERVKGKLGGVVVQAVPTFAIFRDGKLVKKLTGWAGRPALRKTLAAL